MKSLQSPACGAACCRRRGRAAPARVAAAAAEHAHAPEAEAKAKPAHGHGHGGAGSGVGSQGFVGEMRKVAMKLHTREQAPKEGAAKPAEKSKPMAQAREAACALCRAQSLPQWKPTLDTYASFLAENKVLYDTIESLIASSSDPSLTPFRASGLERGPALAKDIAALQAQGVSVPAAASAGATYAEYLTTLAATDVPSFICHFYNVYFAHTAGGRMIGASIVQALALPPQSFYAWDGDLQASMDGVRTNINAVAEKWSDGEKERCLKETAKSFEMSGGLLRLLVSEPVAA